MRRRAQIDFGDVPFQDAVVDDQMLQLVEFLLPAGFRQLDHHAVIQDQVPAPLGDTFIGGDAGGDGAMGHHRIHQIGGGFGRAGAHQLGQAGEFLDALGGDDAAGAFHHGDRLALSSGDLPQREGPFLDHRHGDGVGIAAHHIGGGDPVQRHDAGAGGGRSAAKIDWPGFRPSAAKMVSVGTRRLPVIWIS